MKNTKIKQRIRRNAEAQIREVLPEAFKNRLSFTGQYCYINTGIEEIRIEIKSVLDPEFEALILSFIDRVKKAKFDETIIQQELAEQEKEAKASNDRFYASQQGTMSTQSKAYQDKFAN